MNNKPMKPFSEPRVASARRLLICIPIVHTQADMGALNEPIQRLKVKKLGKKMWEHNLELVKDFLGGTFFLDEVSNMPLGSQAKLLRVLQDRTIHRIGGTRPIDVDVRVLAASNQDLQKLTEGEEGSLRRDVYFRLNEFAIRVPPLRERREDILYLAKRFVDLTNLELQKDVRSFTEAAVDLLLSYYWPGNVRQLRSTIRRAVLLADNIIEEQHLAIEAARPALLADLEGASNVQIPAHPDCSLKEIVQHNTALVERGVLARVLCETRGNKAEAARLLHIDYKTIQLKIKGYGLQIDRATRGGF